MKALTICQPYAELIMRRLKRVENRTWPTKYRGPMYIHAGKSRHWLEAEDLRCYPNMPFGAVVGIADVIDCLPLLRIEQGEFDQKYPWLRAHEHANGPWCWILDNVVPIGPWPYRGAQGLFEIRDGVLDKIANDEIEKIRPCQETSSSSEVAKRSDTIARSREVPSQSKEG